MQLQKWFDLIVAYRLSLSCLCVDASVEILLVKLLTEISHQHFTAFSLHDSFAWLRLGSRQPSWRTMEQQFEILFEVAFFIDSLPISNKKQSLEPRGFTPLSGYLTTPLIAEIICVKNVGAIVVCGFLLNNFKKIC